MSAIEETNTAKIAEPQPVTDNAVIAKPSLLTRFLNLLSSVRFGIILLIILGILSFIGMIVMQQNIQGFDRYYVALTPSERLVYSNLGLFDIYHTWYYNVLLLVLSLNIILASIERAPKSWRIVSNRKLEASRTWLLAQQQHTETRIESESLKSASERVLNALRSMRFKTTVLEKDGRVHIFGEKGWWNRLGYLAVHVGLLTIFTGGFLTNQFGQDGMMPLTPGETSSQMFRASISLDKVTQTPVQLPFTISCTDIEQKLIRKDGSIDSSNTIDWLTRIKIKDEYGEHEALVNLNRPYDYRGYRLFQAQFTQVARARNITLQVTPENGSTSVKVKIPRNGSATLPDGTKIDFKDFYPNSTVGPNGLEEIESGGEYVKPVAILQVTKSDGTPQKAFAYNMDLPSGAPAGAPVAGYKFKLADFEKVSLGHTLSINKDPGRIPFYVGGAFLIAALIGVFFFSHQRVWASVEEDKDKFNVVLGGNTNRNQLRFEDKFKGLVEQISEKANDQEKTQGAKA